MASHWQGKSSITLVIQLVHLPSVGGSLAGFPAQFHMSLAFHHSTWHLFIYGMNSEPTPPLPRDNLSRLEERSLVLLQKVVTNDGCSKDLNKVWALRLEREWKHQQCKWGLGECLCPRTHTSTPPCPQCKCYINMCSCTFVFVKKKKNKNSPPCVMRVCFYQMLTKLMRVPVLIK